MFATPRSFDAWVRFGGPGPLSPPDMRDNGLLSVGIKLMGVEGEKLLDDERHTQDFTALSSPTFTTPDVIENVKLQRRLRQGLPGFYFLDPRDSHLLDAIMQGLYARAHRPARSRRPTGARSRTCSARGRRCASRCTRAPPSARRLPRRPAPNYLRHAMARTLGERAVELDFRVQLQTDAHRMPLENASVIWPERLSPSITVARLHLPVQRFDSPEQLAFARSLSFQPWHSIAEHRPLGSQNRARKAIYYEFSKLRQELNGDPRVEPDGERAVSLVQRQLRH